MKQLILTSSGFIRPVIRQIIMELLPSDVRRVLYIPTASNVVKDGAYAQNDVFIMNCLGFQISEIDLANINQSQLEQALNQSQLIYVQGGNGFYLLKHARTNNFIPMVATLVNQGKLIYIGKSAGSYLACPSLDMHTWTNTAWNRYGLTDLTAMNLVPFMIKAHYHPDQLAAIEQGINNSAYRVKLITNDQAVYVKGDQIKTVGDGELTEISL